MFLETQSLDVSFRLKHSEGFYMVYASAGLMKCFECGDVGDKRVLCLHWQNGVGAPTLDAPTLAAAALAQGALMFCRWHCRCPHGQL